MLTTSCRLIFPTSVSATRNFWKDAKGAKRRMTRLGVLIDQASWSGYQGTGRGGST